MTGVRSHEASSLIEATPGPLGPPAPSGQVVMVTGVPGPIRRASHRIIFVESRTQP